MCQAEMSPTWSKFPVGVKRKERAPWLSAKNKKAHTGIYHLPSSHLLQAMETQNQSSFGPSNSQWVVLAIWDFLLPLGLELSQSLWSRPQALLPLGHLGQGLEKRIRAIPDLHWTGSQLWRRCDPHLHQGQNGKSKDERIYTIECRLAQLRHHIKICPVLSGAPHRYNDC